MRSQRLATLITWFDPDMRDRGVRDERVLMGVTGGVMWTAGALVALVGQLMPRAPHEHLVWILTVGTAVLAYGIASVTQLIPWTRFTVRRHAIALFLLCPIIALAVWATGGVESYVQPLLIFPMLHIAYFFPLRYARLLGAWLILMYATPLVYDDRALDTGYPARLLGFTVAMAFLTVVMIALKGRLLAAEASQAAMARQDPLTGLANRRAFDDALAAEIARDGEPGRGRRAADDGRGFALLLLDLDGFKAVNDTFGHQAGDRVLRDVAAWCLAAVRPGDCVARIGGDEFAIVAPRAGAAGAERLVAAVRAGVGQVAVPAGAHVGVTIASGTYPADGTTAEQLMHVVDRRLYERKGAAPVV
jgi:diguanylate cyclase (GGDEF)-like protein